MKLQAWLSNETKKITIIGCGNVGSSLAYLITQRSNYQPDLKSLTLIDYDLLHPPNLPYISLGYSEAIEENFLHNPKVFALDHELQKIMTNESNMKIHIDYNKIINFNELDHDSLIIDCRDTGSQSDKCDFKLCQDGPFARMILNPKDLNDNGSGRYRIESNKFFAMALTMKFMLLIESLKITEKANEFFALRPNPYSYQWVYDFRRGDQHVTCN